MRTSTLLLGGPNELSRAALKSLFKGSPFTVIGEVSDIAMIDPCVLPEPEIALLECPGDSYDVLDAVERLDEIYPDTPVVVLNDKVDMATLIACLAAGASGFVNKDISPDALLRSLQLAVLGETVFPTCLAGLLVDDDWERWPLGVSGDNVCGLSDREIEVLQCILWGESNKLIARRLSIAVATIKMHVKNLFRKIKASNRTQAAVWAHRHGFRPARRWRGDRQRSSDEPKQRITEMLKSTKSRAEKRFAATQKRYEQALTEKEKARQEEAERTASLRGLRLAKEAADKEAAEAATSEKEAANNN